MSPLSWISVVMVICGVLTARQRATEVDNLQSCFLVSLCVLAYVLIRRYATLLSSSPQSSSVPTIASGPSEFIPYAEELNESLYELYKPLDIPITMYVIFLHGLQSEDNRDPHLSTWKSGDGLCLWPQTWLIEEFPGAHVLSVSYTAHVKKNMQGDFDIFNIGENLLSDILQADVGQAPHCPVILVGHCFGGFVIKELCNRAYDSFTRASDLQKKEKLRKLLESIRGIYYYGTPHHGSPLMDKEVHHLGSSLLVYFKLLSKEGARLNEKFEQLRRLYPKWRIHGLGESLSTKTGLFQGFVGAPEASSRAGDSFNVIIADHIQICRPQKKTNRSFFGLVEVLESIAKDVKVEQALEQEEEARTAEKSSLQNLQYLPKEIIGIEDSIEQVKTKLFGSTTLGLVGMGGCGKTTLSKAIFNNLEREFEYSSFVHEVKLISGRADDVKKEVWSQMRQFGNEMPTKPTWSLLKEKRLLLVLDDVSSDRDLNVLFDIAKDLSPESRFLVTSRDRDLVKTLDEIYDVPFLRGRIAKEIFMKYAFPEKYAPPHLLESLVDEIVAKCDGLPLTLEVIGKYLLKRDEKQDWEQTLIALGRADSVAGLDERLWEKLKLSFIGLQENEQQVFLDVATFFCGNENCTLGEAKMAWKAAYAPANERLLWRTLVDRSLVYDVEDNDKIQMHEQLLDLGRKIGAKRNNKRRVWELKEALDLFQTTPHRHDEGIFSLSLHLHRSRIAGPTLSIARTALLSLTEVRYLKVRGNATIYEVKEDEEERRLTNLVNAGLHGVHPDFSQVLFSSIILTRLVFLYLSFYDGELLPESFGDMSALKVLKLFECGNLHSLPKSFGQLSALSDLQFSYCYRLQTLSESFGQLLALSNLQFESCIALQTLPRSFGHLSALSSLQFRHCWRLQTLPESFGLLSALSSLQFRHCWMLQTLPESFGLLSELRNLEFSFCEDLQTLPESFGLLSALVDLEFNWCENLQTLPKTFGQLSALERLQFHNCKAFLAIPSSFGQLTKLEELRISDCLRLDISPDFLEDLISLRYLSLEQVALTTVHDSIRSLPSLQVLQLGYLPFVKEFPPWLGGAEAGLRKMSIKTFHVQDGNFSLAGQSNLDEAKERKLIEKLHILGLERLTSSNVAMGCEECGRYPLEWPRYVSKLRPRYVVSKLRAAEILCPDCFRQSDVDATEYNCENSAVYHYVRCYFCERFPLKGPRYKSWAIYNQKNLCQDCFQTRGDKCWYLCSDPPVLSAGDGTTDVLDAILDLDADDRNSEIHWSSNRVQYRVFIFQERGIVKRMMGDLRGALEDLSKALEIVLGQNTSEDDFLENVQYACLKHRAHVKFLLGDVDGARTDAEEALSIGWSEHFYPFENALGNLPVKFLDVEMRRS